jgi:hypothetical protein
MESDSATSESSPSHPSIEHEYSHPGDIFLSLEKIKNYYQSTSKDLAKAMSVCEA